MLVPSFPNSNTTSITVITRPGMADFQGRDWLPLILLPLSASFFIIRADFRCSGAGLNPAYAILFYFILSVCLSVCLCLAPAGTAHSVQPPAEVQPLRRTQDTNYSYP